MSENEEVEKVDERQEKAKNMHYRMYKRKYPQKNDLVYVISIY